MCRTANLILPLLAFVSLCGWASGQKRKLDPTNFVVVGGEIAAGFSDFVLSKEGQEHSFPALMAGQMDTIMPQPLIRDGGPVKVITYDPLPAILPAFNQSSLRDLPFPLFVFNLSIPFLRVSESLSIGPQYPLVHEQDVKQSLVNLILGYPIMILDDPPLWAQVEYAERMAPTFLIVQLGFGDVAEAALSGDASRITSAADFSRDYSLLIQRLRGTHAQILLLNVPDPADTAYFSSVQKVAEAYETTPEFLEARFGLQPSDLITLGGLVEIADSLRGRTTGPLSPEAVLEAEIVAAISAAVASYNSAVNTSAGGDLPVYDLAGFIREVRDQGVEAGSLHLGGGYLEGFYSSDGMFPTSGGQAVLANRLLEFVNRSWGSNYPPVDAGSIAVKAPAGRPLGPGFEALAGLEVVR